MSQVKNQNVGFEREDLFTQVLFETLKHHPGFKARTLRSIISRIAPEFGAGLFERRPCVRTLRYRGYWWCEGEDFNDPDEYCVIGQIYESMTFNGGTYTIQGRDNPIGCAYFDWIEEEDSQASLTITAEIAEKNVKEPQVDQ